MFIVKNYLLFIQNSHLTVFYLATLSLRAFLWKQALNLGALQARNCKRDRSSPGVPDAGTVWIDGVWGCRLNWEALPTAFEELGAGDQSVMGAEVPHKELGWDDMKWNLKLCRKLSVQPLKHPFSPPSFLAFLCTESREMKILHFSASLAASSGHVTQFWPMRWRQQMLRKIPFPELHSKDFKEFTLPSSSCLECGRDDQRCSSHLMTKRSS